ncbi:PF13600 domain protein [Leptospira inadai serovar Lyme str. 10]|uniref:PF13600 domain protein n=2 Tax=Leptospira inadai serovar Lyme TaxID=293084 RepID=V6H7S4_9LEPT|nr:DUF4139 domain-containing protein [Leptospira inadai]EQA34791.1 PF13600 domain protein [Leptospira inadai serovar Lyme str. 10]PNV76016.1 DUF4139 domain-containing protein [Leptospira inadai serovar Lyme]
MSSLPRLIRKYSPIILIVLGGLVWPRDGKSQDSEDSPVADTQGNSSPKTAMATANSRIESVLLYSDFAYAKRVAEIKLPAGAFEVSLGEVPSNILDKSVSVSFSDPNKKFKIRGVRVLEKVSKRFKSQESEELEKRKDALLLSLGTRSKEVQELLDWETSLRSIRPAFREEEGVIEKVDSDSFLGFRKTYSDLAEENTKLRLAKLEELDRLREEFYIVTAKLEHLAQGDILRRKEIRLEAEIETATTYRIEYKYLIRGAIWYPRYTLDLKPSGTEAELGWYALVRNETGEDWNGVRLEFSTANPNQDVDLPDYRELRISSKVVVNRDKDSYHANDQNVYNEQAKGSPSTGAPVMSKPAKEAKKRSSRPQASKTKQDDIDDQAESPLEKSRAIIESNFKDRSNSLQVEENMDQLRGELANQKSLFESGSYEDSIRYGKEALRRFSGLRESSRKELRDIESQVQTLLNRSSQLNSDRKYVYNLVAPGLSSEGFDFRYIAQSFERIPSDKTLNRVFLRKRIVPVSPAYESSPITGEEAYLTVVSTNLEREPLLSGPLEIYSGENLLGTTSVSTLKPGEKIRIELGPDRDVKIVRREEKFEDKSGLISKRKTVRHKVSISIKNNKKRKILIRVIDRVPYTVDDSVDIKWSLGSERPDKTDDGILTYEMDLAAGAVKKIEFEYTVSYPANNLLRDSQGSGSY